MITIDLLIIRMPIHKRVKTTKSGTKKHYYQYINSKTNQKYTKYWYEKGNQISQLNAWKACKVQVSAIKAREKMMNECFFIDD